MQRKPQMQPLLGKPSTQGSKSRVLVGAVESIIGIVVLMLSFWHAVHYLEDHVTKQPLFIAAYPILGACFIVFILPFFMFLSFKAEFKDLHPLVPSHYLFLLRRIFAAVQQNNSKISAKEL